MPKLGIKSLLSRLVREETAFYDRDDVTVLLDLARKVAEQHEPDRMCCTRPADVGNYLMHRYRDVECEYFGILFLDNKHRIIAHEPEFFRGTIDGCAVYPREVVKAALKHNAAALILWHPHPSGNPEPSEADRAITRRLVEALGIVDVRVLDHLVIGRTSWVSLAERGWL